MTHAEKNVLNEAISAGNVDAVERFLKAYPLSNEECGAALTLAASTEHHKNIAITIFVHRRDEKHNTALHMVASEGNLELAKNLIRHGADVNAQNKNNNTPLHMAAANNHLSVVELLFQSEASTDVTNEGRVTPLEVSIWQKHKDVTNFLVLNRNEAEVKESEDTSSESSQLGGMATHSVVARTRTETDLTDGKSANMHRSSIDYSS